MTGVTSLGVCALPLLLVFAARSARQGPRCGPASPGRWLRVWSVLLSGGCTGLLAGCRLFFGRARSGCLAPGCRGSSPRLVTWSAVPASSLRALDGLRRRSGRSRAGSPAPPPRAPFGLPDPFFYVPDPLHNFPSLHHSSNCTARRSQIRSASATGRLSVSPRRLRALVSAT